jgi:glutathione synthase/RimK-type ligase-like ATP-grasp enzyme
VQEVANNPGRDVRVYVIGKKIIAAMLRVSETDFRSNFCLGGKAEIYNLNEDEKKLINKIISLFDFDFVGIDFVFNDGKIIFNEIEDVVGSRMLYTHTDIDIAQLFVEYILNNIKQ